MTDNTYTVSILRRDPSHVFRYKWILMVNGRYLDEGTTDTKWGAKNAARRRLKKWKNYNKENAETFVL